VVALASILLARRVAVMANAPRSPFLASELNLPEIARRTVVVTGIDGRDVPGGTDGPQRTTQTSDVL